MEENTSMFNNKIVGILVAVIVLATVLVPICNAYSNGGGDSPSPMAEGDIISYTNPGSPMSLFDFDWNDHSQTYTWYADGEYQEGEIVVAVIDSYGNLSTSSYEPNRSEGGSQYPFIGNGDVEDYCGDITLRWDDTFGDPEWRVHYQIEEGEGSNGIANGQLYVYDSTANIHIVSLDRWLGDSLSDIRLTVDSECSFTLQLFNADEDEDTIYANAEYRVENGNIYLVDAVAAYEWDDAELIEVPTVNFNLNGILTISGKFVLNYNGHQYTTNPTFSWGGGYVPKVVEIRDVPTPEPDNGNSDNSNGGISSTLIGIIPVFVAVALLGAIVALFIRKDSLTE